jgi:acetyl-CoA carboxylase biotin carboxylase subunit
MIGKLIVKGKDRNEAVAVGKRALREFHIGGVSSTILFHQYMLEDPQFLDSKYDLTYIDKLIAEGCRFTLD